VSGDDVYAAIAGPEQVWIDERVARGMAADKDLELAERGIEQICYIRDDVASEMVRQAAGHQHAETIVQIASVVPDAERALERITLLTSHGRLFIQVTGGWKELPGPELHE